MLHKFIKEPLLHFLGGALLVFLFFWASGSNRDPADYTIRIDETDLARLESDWVRNFRRAPTRPELDSLIDQEIAEEIYYREALRLGLDKNDAVIRRRLYTKMRFVEGEDTAAGPPTDAALNQWMARHPERYRLAPLYDFEQVYLGRIAAAEARVRIEQLNAGADAAGLARPLSLPGAMQGAAIEDISRTFGDTFAKALAALEPGAWSGPVTSGFGIHAARVTARKPGKAASLDEVRQRVTNDWQAEQQAKQRRQALARYRQQYTISVAGRR